METDTTERRPTLLREHRCEHPTDARIGDRFRCFCGRTWRVVARVHGQDWAQDGSA